MEYNTKENVERIRVLLELVEYDAHRVLDGLGVAADNDTLDLAWRYCEMIESYVEEARVLIGKMSDEREDMEGA